MNNIVVSFLALLCCINIQSGVKLQKQGSATQLVVNDNLQVMLTGCCDDAVYERTIIFALVRFYKFPICRNEDGVDSQENTVIMMQVENEIGMLESARDHSPHRVSFLQLALFQSCFGRLRRFHYLL